MADLAKTDLFSIENKYYDNLDVNSAVNSVISELDKRDYCNNLYDKFINDTASEFLNYLNNIDINPDTYEDLFCLSSFKSSTFPNIQEQNVQNIKYKDNDGNTVALVQVDRNNNRIRLQSFGNVFPKQEFKNPINVVSAIEKFIFSEQWDIEDGGINQFDGNIETRYKDQSGHVKAAIITKPDKKSIDTVVLYQYSDNKKYKMIHYSQYNLSVTIYDPESGSTFMVIEIDTDGNVCGITINYN